jgi:hypothetical protein
MTLQTRSLAAGCDTTLPFRVRIAQHSQHVPYRNGAERTPPASTMTLWLPPPPTGAEQMMRSGDTATHESMSTSVPVGPNVTFSPPLSNPAPCARHQFVCERARRRTRGCRSSSSACVSICPYVRMRTALYSARSVAGSAVGVWRGPSQPLFACMGPLAMFRARRRGVPCAAARAREARAIAKAKPWPGLCSGAASARPTSIVIVRGSVASQLHVRSTLVMAGWAAASAAVKHRSRWRAPKRATILPAAVRTTRLTRAQRSRNGGWNSTRDFSRSAGARRSSTSECMRDAKVSATGRAVTWRVFPQQVQRPHCHCHCHWQCSPVTW